MNQTNTRLHQTGTRKVTLSGILQNNDLVLRSLYEGVFPKVRRFILQNNGSEEQAKDTFQEAFIATWKNVKEGKFTEQKGTSVEAYLYTIAKNKWLDYLRSSKYKKTSYSNSAINMERVEAREEDDPTETDDTQKEMDAMRQAFEKLGAHCKVLLNLFYFERKSMDEISLELKIVAASARNQKYRCMEKLRSLTFEIKANG